MRQGFLTRFFAYFVLAFLIMLLAACNGEVSYQSRINHKKEHISKYFCKELPSENAAEPEIIHNYQNICHDSSHIFYDFIEQDIRELPSLNETQSINKAYLEQARYAFEADMAKKEIYFTDVQTAWIYDIDFNRDSVYETIILYEGTVDNERSAYILGINMKEDSAEKYMGLYFIASDGTVAGLADCEEIVLAYLYVYPKEKQLAIFCYKSMSYQEQFFGYDGEEMKTVLRFGDAVQKDNCFISLRARVGVYHPVSPAMCYWNSESFEYVPLTANEIPIDDFINQYNGSGILRELGISNYETECQGICTIGNYKYILFLGNRGNAVVSRDENNNYTIDIAPHYIGAGVYELLPDVDYFEACRQMISVEEW